MTTFVTEKPVGFDSGAVAPQSKAGNQHGPAAGQSE